MVKDVAPRPKKGDIVVSLSAGVFIGVAIVHALPEAANHFGLPVAIATFVIGAFFWWTQKLVLDRLHKKDYSPLIGTTVLTHAIVEGIAGGLIFAHSHVFGLAVLAGLLLHHLPDFLAALYMMRDVNGPREASLLVPVTSIALLLLTYVLTPSFLTEFNQFPPILAGVAGGAFLYVGLRSWWPRRREDTLILVIIGILLYTSFLRLIPFLIQYQ